MSPAGLLLLGVIGGLAGVAGKVTVYLTDGPLQRIGPRLYKRELLTDSFKEPRELAYDSATRELYFAHMDDELGDSGRARVHVGTRRAERIDGIRRGKAAAVDADSGDVYFGAPDGLYRLRRLAAEAHRTALYNVDVLQLVLRDNAMFLLDAGDHRVYRVTGRGTGTVRVSDVPAVVRFEVDHRGAVHYVTVCGVYCGPRGGPPVRSRLDVVSDFLVDQDRTFGVAPDGIYELHCANGTATKVGELGFVPRSITLGDYGDVFYSLDDSIYRLKPILSYLVYDLRTNTKRTVRTHGYSFGTDPQDHSDDEN